MEIVFLFYDGMTALDAIGPHEILSRMPGARTRRAAIHEGPVQTDSGIVLMADCSISAVSKADVLVIPGAGNATSLRQYPEMMDWIRQIHQTTTWTTSVCTGSLILGAAGLLQGVKATTHWAAMELLPMWGAEPTQARIVEEGKIITAAGVSAGIDMALVLASKIVSPLFAQSMELGIEYDPEPPFKTGSPEKAPKPLIDALRSRMSARFEK